jgi:hypothetical protein
MQTELDAAGLPIEVRILGVNAIGLESGNPSITMNRTLPWLQDTAEQKAWETWGVAWRDVWLLDTKNVPVAVYNLTQHNLSDPAQYAELMGMLEDIANANAP